MASAKNCSIMSRRLAPIALRTPISRVRSVTDTSIMFITPMPPTSSEMPAIAPRNTTKVLVVSSSAWIVSSWLVTVKSFSPISRWRSRSTAVISFIVSCDALSSLALTLMESTITSPCTVRSKFSR